MHHHIDSPHFLHLCPISPHFHANSAQPHSNLIRRIATLILRISLIPFPFLQFPVLQFWVLQTYNVISVITKNYLPNRASSKKYIICEVWAKNSECLKCYLSFKSKGGTTTCNYYSFLNLSQFPKIYVTKFDLSRF